jgi:hypothetical protein
LLSVKIEFGKHIWEVRFNISPVNDVSGPERIPDGFPDLVCQLFDDPGQWKPGESTATLMDLLLNGMPFEGIDEIYIRP